MIGQSVREYWGSVRPRCLAAAEKAAQRILDEFCASTGMHRKAAIRLLNYTAQQRGHGNGQVPATEAVLIDAEQDGVVMRQKELPVTPGNRHAREDAPSLTVADVQAAPQGSGDLLGQRLITAACASTLARCR
jgi:hypothetical protein